MNRSTPPEYIFTPTGFLIENTENDANEEVRDCYHLLYEMGTSTQPDNLTMSGYFLFQVAEKKYGSCTERKSGRKKAFFTRF